MSTQVLITILADNVWQLSFLLVALTIFQWFRAEISPIFQSMTVGLKAQAAKNSLVWAMGIMLGLLACLQSMGKVAHGFGWIYVEGVCDVLQPALAAVVGYIIKGPAIQPPTGNTVPPMQP